jgi:sodium-dependent phosphate cotransporter
MAFEDKFDGEPKGSKLRTTFKVLAAIALLYVFLVGIKLMGTGCKSLAKEKECLAKIENKACLPDALCANCKEVAEGEGSFANRMIGHATNPFVALFVGILVTSIIQSSAVTTSIVVALVAGGTLQLHAAIPIVMGANIGTTVTNMLVSMGYVMRREEFKRAIGGAVVHDLFNVMVVMILLPIEIATGFLEQTTLWLVEPLQKVGGFEGEAFNPLGPILKPALDLAKAIIGKPDGPGWVAGITALAGLLCIFCALLSLIKLLRSMMLGAAESFISNVVGKSGYLGIVIGFVITASVHSSSIVTSLLVPMAASGIMSVGQIFPITIGANIGTTTTALIAALAGSPQGLAIALVHFLFNVVGLLMFYPIPAMRQVPVRLAERIGQFAGESRKMMVFYTLCLFFGVPGLLIFVHSLF